MVSYVVEGNIYCSCQGISVAAVPTYLRYIAPVSVPCREVELGEIRTGIQTWVRGKAVVLHTTSLSEPKVFHMRRL
jgi:hypothetical protein